MVKKADIPDHVIDTALALAAERGWRDLSLVEIAAAAKLPLSKLYPHYPSKTAILDAFMRRTDAAVLAEETEPEGSARDRIFDVLMRRFDALQPHRDRSQSRSANLVDGNCGSLHRYSGGYRGLAGRILTTSGREHLT